MRAFLLLIVVVLLPDLGNAQESDHEKWVSGDKRPLVNCWNISDIGRRRNKKTNEIETGPGWGETDQRKLLNEGKHVLPTFGTHWSFNGVGILNVLNPERESFIEFCRARNLPICLRSPNMPDIMALGDWYELPQEKSAVTWRMDRTPPAPTRLLSPTADPALWARAGSEWAKAPIVQQIVEAYPNPPAVYWLDNNETLVYDRAQLKRGVIDTTVPPEILVDDATILDPWIEDQFFELYKVFHAAIRASLPEAWNPKFIGYELPYSFRLSVWDEENGDYGPGRNFDGCSPGTAYLNHWDAKRDVEHSATPDRFDIDVAGQKWLKSQNPDFEWWQSTWHGTSKTFVSMPRLFTTSTFVPNRPQDYPELRVDKGVVTPDRYAGMIKYFVFVHRPRVVSHFTAATVFRTDPVVNDTHWAMIEEMKGEGIVPQNYPRYTEQDFWDACVESVEVFWRDDMEEALEGELLEGPFRLTRHFWENVTGPMADKEQWFGLRTSEDSVIEGEEWFVRAAWDNGTFHRPVKAAARETEDAFYVYAYAPLGVIQNVTIYVNESVSVTGDVPQGGRFWKLSKIPQAQIIGEELQPPQPLEVSLPVEGCHHQE